MAGHAVGEATGRASKKRPKNDVSDREVVVLGSGNLGLVYLMERRERFTLEELDERHPRLIGALREHPHVGWLLVRSAERGAVVLGARGAHYLNDRRVEGEEDPLAPFSPTAPDHLRRTDGFASRSRHPGRQLLRPRPRRGLRVRGADLLPRRPRGRTDAAVPPLPQEPPGPGRANSRRRRGAPAPLGLAPHAPVERRLGG